MEELWQPLTEQCTAVLKTCAMLLFGLKPAKCKDDEVSLGCVANITSEIVAVLEKPLLRDIVVSSVLEKAVGQQMKRAEVCNILYYLRVRVRVRI